MKFGVCYYVLGCIEPYLEFVDDESLECVIHRVKTNDFTGVRFARTGLDEVPYINICDESGYCLYRIPVTELQHNSFGYILDNYGDDDSDDVNTANQGESADVENNTASEQDNTVKKFFFYSLLLCYSIFVLIYSFFSSSNHSSCFIDGATFGIALSSFSYVLPIVSSSFFKWFKQSKAVEK